MAVAASNGSAIMDSFESVARLSQSSVASYRILPRKSTQSSDSPEPIKEHLGLDTNESCSDKPPAFTDNPRGYEVFMHNDGETVQNVSHSRLLATLKVDSLKDLKGKHVHHTSRIPWLNTENNIKVMNPSDHIKHHHETDTAEITLNGKTEKF